jgi:hypothetical protein
VDREVQTKSEIDGNMLPDGSSVGGLLIPEVRERRIAAAATPDEGINTDVLNNAKKELMIGDRQIELPTGISGIQMPVQQQKLVAKKAGGLGFVKKLFGGK